jgi:hypothetical protein
VSLVIVQRAIATAVDVSCQPPNKQLQRTVIRRCGARHKAARGR